MARKLTFAEFDAKLKSARLTDAERQRYLELDPDAATVRVRFRAGALADAPPPGYDVDREVYFAERAQEEKELARVSHAARAVTRPRVLAEGDSWFRMPLVVRPVAIATRLAGNGRVKVKNIARWGHTLRQMLNAREYLTAQQQFNADWLIFSGGGNDLQECLAELKLVHPYDPNRPIDECLTPRGMELLGEIAEGYRSLLNEVAITYPTLNCLCYAYDYPRPRFRGGQYIGRHLDRLGYPKSTWDAVAKVLIRQLSEHVSAVVTTFSNARFLDCRGVTTGFRFFDDMHPDSNGFTELARKFEQGMGITPRRAPARKSAKSRRKAAKRNMAMRKPARAVSGKTKAKRRGDARRKK